MTVRGEPGGFPAPIYAAVAKTMLNAKRQTEIGRMIEGGQTPPLQPSPEQAWQFLLAVVTALEASVLQIAGEVDHLHFTLNPPEDE